MDLVPDSPELTERQRQATLHTVLDVPAATRVIQVVGPGGPDNRSVTTIWYGAGGSVLRQDQTILVDRMPALAGEVGSLTP